MKIALITEHFYPYTGGITEHTFYLAQALAKNHEVFVIAPLYPKVKFVPLPERPEFEIVRIGKAGFFPANGSLTAFTYTPSSILTLKRLLKHEKFDVIHIQGSVVPTLPFFSALFNVDSVKVVTFHAYHGKSTGYSIFKPPLKKALSGIDGYIAVSFAALITIQRHFDLENIKIIPNGVDTNRFTPCGIKLPEFDDGKFNILFVGRMEKRKGLQILIEALRGIENKDIRLIVAGDGPLLKKHKKQSERLNIEVRFLGKVSPHTLASLYRTASVFVAPSTKGESFGIVLLEAMASGIPVIASSIPGYTETLEEGVYGLIFQNRNPHDLREKILNVYKNKPLREKLSAKGLYHVRSKYSWNKIAEKTEKFYLKLLEGKGPLKEKTKVFDRL